MNPIRQVPILWLFLGCAATPPPHWSDGGAPLVLADARWDRDGEDSVSLGANGEVTEDGSLLFVIDRAGRVVDGSNEPVALLTPSGELLGTDRAFLGRVGVVNAAPPHSDTAWLTVQADGTVVRYDDDGERSTEGRWYGCQGARQRTCTLVTHLIALRGYRAPSSGVSVGVGIGVAF